MKCVTAAASLAVLLVLAPVAGAQTAPLPDLADRLAIGEKVIVLDRSGKTASGLLEKLSAEEIVVRSATNTIAIPAGDVRRVAVPRHGKRNGFLIGGGLGLVMGLAFTRREVEGSGRQAAFVAASAGLYGAIGLGIGALLPTERVIYRAPDAAPAANSLARAGAGRRLTIGFRVRW